MFDFLSVVNLVVRTLSDPTLQEAVAKLVEWIRTLTPAEQAAYASKFQASGGYGAASFGCDAPDCPHDCKGAEAVLLSAAKGD